MEKKFEGQEVPCPPNWGGYRIEATELEFWFGHSGRLHERYVYAREKSSIPWKTFMRSP
jgi:pyridoxamine 5'-phosphate oxidase